MITKRKANGQIAPVNVLERLAPFMGDTDEECWDMTGADKCRGGHKRIRLDDKSRMMVHKLAWEAHHAMPVPDGGYVLHECDNPQCFNPHHLYIGTLAENSADRFERNRDSYHRKISLEDTETIRSSDEPNPVLAKRYGVTPERIGQIKRAK